MQHGLDELLGSCQLGCARYRGWVQHDSDFRRYQSAWTNRFISCIYR